MTPSDALGWAACVMTFVTFAQQRMIPLRCAAVMANLFFIGYAALGHYLPVLVLHLTLLPVNAQRLVSLVVNWSRERTAADIAAHAKSGDAGRIAESMRRSLQALFGSTITLGGPR